MTTDIPPEDARLSRAELLDLFKHWDTRVSHHEMLYTPLSAAAIPAVAASWDKMSPVLILTVALGSLGLYVFNLLCIRRFAVFQEQVFLALKVRVADFGDLMRNPKKRIGVQRLRLLILPSLASLWCFMLFSFIQHPNIVWSIVIAILFLVPAVTTAILWGKTDVT